MEDRADNVKDLRHLGSQGTSYKYENPSPDILDAFQNKFPDGDYVVEFVFNEFTSLCPKTGQPDFAGITIQYVPDELCVETKSLKLYFFAFRNCGTFMETITNTILRDIVAKIKPKRMKVIGRFASRGGIALTYIADYHKQDGSDCWSDGTIGSAVI